MVLHVDEGLRLLGRYSRWQIVKYIIIGVGLLVPFSLTQMSIVFIADIPRHRCKIPHNSTLNETIPGSLVKGRWRWSQCRQYLNKSYSNDTQHCEHGHQFDSQSGYQSTIVTDFGLVCDKAWMAELAMAMCAAGNGVGGLFFNILADRYGRRPVAMAAVYSFIVVSFIKAFSPHLALFAVLHFINGIQIQGMTDCNTVLLLELFPTEGRTFAGAALEYFWSTGFVLTTLLGYLIRNWRHLQITISLLSLCLSLSFYWYLPESIPWLVANEKYKEADSIMHKAAKFNKKKLRKHIFTQPNLTTVPLSDTEKKDFDIFHHTVEGAGTLKDIITSPSLRMHTVIMTLVWFTTVLVYYGANFTVTTLAGDRYLNLFLFGLIEIPGYTFAWFLMAKVGRIITLCVSHLVVAISVLGALVQYQDFTGQVAVSITFSMIARFFMACTFSGIIQFTPELYPTNLRNKGLGFCQFIGRGAALLAPFARFVGRLRGWAPNVIFSVLSLMACIVVILLPETRWRPLAETVSDTERWHSESKFYKPRLHKNVVKHTFNRN